MGLSIPDPLRRSRRGARNFAHSQDLTLAIEEEFQIVDPETLGLVNRFRGTQGARRRHAARRAPAGELISSEIEVKTGRCGDVSRGGTGKLIEHRRALLDEAEAMGVALAACGTTRGRRGGSRRSSTRRTTASSRDAALRRLAQRRVGPHPRRRARMPIAPSRSTNAMRSVLPDLLALSASSPWYKGRYTHLHSTRTQLFTRMFPRCGSPEPFDGWADCDRSCAGWWRPARSRSTPRKWWCCNRHQWYGRSCATPTRSPTCARVTGRDGLRLRPISARRLRAKSREARARSWSCADAIWRTS